MPLNPTETKAMLIQLFRLTLAVKEQRTEDAVRAFTTILDSSLEPVAVPAVAGTDINDVASEGGGDVQLIISETVAPPPIVVPEPLIHRSFQVNTVGSAFGDKSELSSISGDEAGEAVSIADNLSEDDATEEAVDEAEEAVETEDVDEAEEAVETEDVDEAEEAVETEDVEDEDVDEEVDLELEPVRIKKVMYWKDINSGDIYTYLPEDEGVGDKVGTYVDGKPVFTV